VENLISANNNNINQNQDNARRASTPGASTTSNTIASSGSGGFSSIFNLKSVINAATKTSHPPPQQPLPQIPVPNSNFYVPQPPVDQNLIETHNAAAAAMSQKSVQGSLSTSEKSVKKSFLSVRICICSLCRLF
jgi:hypothetical protein